MLRSLEIRDMLIIDHLVFEPGDELNVLTGETGAGKSILLDSLGFVLGWRGRSDMVRKGCDQGEVEAVFHLSPDHPARAVLDQAGISCEDDDLILRRVNQRDGRKSAWANGRRASGEVLRALSETLVELHGQQDDRGLLNPRVHRKLLDEFGQLGPLETSCRTGWRALAEAAKTLENAHARLAKVQAEEEFLRHSVAELDALAPEAGEEATLDAHRRLMQASERISSDIAKAFQTLGSGEGAEGRISDALRWLEDAQDHAGEIVAAPIENLHKVLDNLGDALAGVEAALQALSFNPHELEQAEERLFAIRALARKHNVTPDALGDFAAGLRDRLRALDQSAEEISGLEAAQAQALATYEKSATRLTAARKKAAKALDKAMAGELAPLKMERAVFLTEVSAAQPGPEGQDNVCFQVATNVGAASGPLNKIASGGELSRFLLALKVCLTRDAAGLTMIFDEIDRGVGGATADAVGRRLADLAVGGQVLVVTHSPQVAACGAVHWQVAKQVKDGVTLSNVTALSKLERVDEIARMLAGDTVTEAARAAARELLKKGQG